MKIKFDKKYGYYSTAILIIIVLLSLFVIDEELNRNIGNILIVAFIYSLTQTFLEFNKKILLIILGLIGILFEFSKLSDWPGKIGIASSRVFENLLGSQFNFDNVWSVIAACVIIYLLEFYDNDQPLRKKKFFGF